MNSFLFLFKAPFNQKHPFRAIFRFILWKYFRVLKLSNIKIKFWKQNYFLINHDSFQSMWLMYNYIVDWEEFLFIHNYLSHNSIVFDIGSNMGFYTIWMSRSLDANGEIHSFEPDQKNHERLTLNSQLNPIRAKCILNNTAVSNCSGSLRITVGLDGKNHLLPESFSGLSSFVNVVSLDDYCKTHKISNIDFIKIDVEGFELDVLKGASDLLHQRRFSVIQLELNKSIVNSVNTIEECIQFIDEIGYFICIFNYELNKLMPIEISSNRENYFLTYNINNINKLLRENKLWKEDIMSC